MRSYFLKPSFYFLLSLVLGIVFADLGLAAKSSRKSQQSRSLTTTEVKELLRQVSTKEANCEKDECDELKHLRDYRNALQGLLEAKVQNEFLKEENRHLKGANRSVAGVDIIGQRKKCLKEFILRDVLTNQGISENGGKIYSKNPIGEMGAVCWSNSKKKKEATSTVCNFPLAIRVQTKGGTEASPIIREREFFFDNDGCNLISARVSEENAKSKIETNLTSEKCRAEWGKRTADATMSASQVRLMEDVIGFCFRYFLLPSPGQKGGLRNPNYSAPNLPVAPPESVR